MDPPGTQAIELDDKRLPYISDSNGEREPRAPPYQYHTLDDKDEQVRILVLQPCKGDLNSPYNYVKCTFDVQSCTAATPFIAIRNGRGYRLLHELIEIDDGAIVISTALEKCLRFLRQPDSTVRIWVRYVCVNQNNSAEMSKYWNRGFVDKMYEQAETVVDMYTMLSNLLNEGHIQTIVDSRYKNWDKEWDSVPDRAPLPKVYPIKLGKQSSLDNPVDDYEYLPLDPVAGEIRIVVVVPDANADAPLLLHLAHCPLGSEVAYHALSYTWGVDTDHKEVVLNGQKMLLRTNLESALRRIRHPTLPVAIWVDAICIDQGNNVEKSRQIPRFGHLLDKAMAVICYVGEEDEYSNTALNLVPQLRGPRVEMDDAYRFIVGSPERIPPEDLPQHCAALYLFLMRSWFRRQWILQEVAFASNPLIVCGSRRDISLEQLDTAAYHLQDMMSRDPDLFGQMQRANRRLQKVDGNELHFVRKLFYFRHLHIGKARYGFIMNAINDIAPGYLESLILSRDFEATVPHDKIFALWNVVRNKDTFQFPMDYARTLEDTYLDFAKAWATHSGSLDILGAAEYADPTDSNNFYAMAPSWCPDWSRPARASPLVRKHTIRKTMMRFMDDNEGPVYSADGALRQGGGQDTYFHMNDQELHCLGIVMDTIVGTTDWEGFNVHRYWGTILGIEEFCKENNMSAYDDIRQAAVSMIHGDVPASWPKRENNQGLVDEGYPGEAYVCIPFKPKLNQDHAPNASRHVPWFGGSYSRLEAMEAASAVMRGRMPFITAKGYIGLMPQYVVPAATSVGERPKLQLAILATCSVPVLLQEHPDHPGAYRLLGSCFVQGWMEGEVLMEEMGCESPQEFWEAMAGSEKLRIL